MKKEEIKNMDDFAKHVHEKLKEYLPEKRYTVSVNTDLLRNITISDRECEAILQVSLQKLYAAYQEGKDVNTILRNISQDYKNTSTSYLEIISQITDNFGRIKNQIYLEAVGASYHQNELMNVPHRKMGDIAAVYVIRKELDADRTMRLVITNDMLRDISISESKLHEIALINSERDKPMVLYSLDDVLKKDMPEQIDPSINSGMFILSNAEGRAGATVLFYPDTFARLEKMFPKGFYVLPSSTHECIILSQEADIPDLGSLSDMVQEINENVVAPEERLSDFAHVYDAKKKTLVADIGQQERLMEIDGTEKRTGRTH